jgi:hypothetical protein
MAKFVSSSDEKDWDDDASLSLDSLIEENSREADRRQASVRSAASSNISSRTQQLFPSTSAASLNEPNQPASLGSAMRTIEPVRRNSSDGQSSYDNLQIAPAHPFFSASFYEDSDGSDGR